MSLPVKEAQTPAVAYNRIQGFRGIAGAQLDVGDIVYVDTVTASGRPVFEKAGGNSEAVGVTAPLFIVVAAGAAEGGLVDAVPQAIATHSLSGGTKMDPVYLKDGGGITRIIGEATVPRIVGHLLDATRWCFGNVSGVVYA